MYKYNYSALRGKIVEKCGSNKKFAEKLGISERSLSLKLTNKVRFSQDEITESANILELCEVKPYFFVI